MDLSVRSDDVLSQRTRARIFAWLVSHQIAAGAHPGGERPVGYGDLARWLAQAFPAGRNRLREVERRDAKSAAKLRQGRVWRTRLRAFAR